MTTQIAPADAAVAAFIADTDNLFTDAYDKLPMAEQRRLYNSYWQRYHAPRPVGVSVEEVHFASAGGMCRALLYRPGQSSMPLATVVYFHGGGWMLGSPESHDLATARICAWTGAAVLSVDYRLSPEHVFPSALMDALAAVSWVAREGRGHGLDPDRLAVAGDSAGGNLAAGLCLWIRDHGGPAIRHQTLIYPALTVTASGGQSGGVSTETLGHYVTGYFGGQALSNNSYAMPLSAKSFAGLPPACVATAEIDPILPHGERFIEHLRHAGIACDYTCGKGLPHTYLRLVHLSAAAQRELEFCCAAIRSSLALQQNRAA